MLRYEIPDAMVDTQISQMANDFRTENPVIRD